tara:strand:+ start:2252 stop:2791 length:540 start_codon:yes stop_codon:yes gene_type:complete
MEREKRMRLLNKISLFLAITPILFILLISSFNLKDKIKLKILIWESTELSLGTFLTLGASMGYVYSFILCTSLQMSDNNFRRKKIVKKEVKPSLDIKDFDSPDTTLNKEEEYYLERDLRDPSPTISIPFKVIRKNSKQISRPDHNQYNQLDNSNTNSDSIDKDSNQNNIDWGPTNLENW